MAPLVYIGIGVLAGAGLARWRPKTAQKALSLLERCGADKLILAGAASTLPDTKAWQIIKKLSS